MYIEWLMSYAYLLLDASCTLPLLFSQGSIILIEHFLSTDCVTVLPTSKGLYIKLQLCSLSSYFISSIPRKLTCYAVTAICLMLWSLVSISVMWLPTFSLEKRYPLCLSHCDLVLSLENAYGSLQNVWHFKEQ